MSSSTAPAPMLLGHEFSEPWRAMRFERATRFGTDLKGLFLHVEMVQPRRSQPGRGRSNDAQAPTPGFTDIQYDRLALIYMIASVRAGRWLIPAFHIAIDSGIRGGHDDPQNFEIEAFAGGIERLANRMRARLVRRPWRAAAGILAPARGRVGLSRPEFVPEMFLPPLAAALVFAPEAGAIHGPAGRDGRVRGHRGARRRRAGAGRARPAGLQHRRPARQGGVGGARAGARRAGRLRPGAAGAAHHRQSRARRPAEGRQPLRSADRARPDGGDRRAPAGRARGLHGARRARARRLDHRRSPACCRRRSAPMRAAKA